MLHSLSIFETMYILKMIFSKYIFQGKEWEVVEKELRFL